MTGVHGYALSILILILMGILPQIYLRLKRYIDNRKKRSLRIHFDRLSMHRK